LEQNNDEFQQVDVNMTGDEVSTSFSRPDHVEPVLLPVVVGPSADSACIAEAGELGITWDDMMETTDEPRFAGVSNMVMELADFMPDRVGDDDSCFGTP
jgi:hypothetical protein